jgi:ribose 5-phosphate isomerase B
MKIAIGNDHRGFQLKLILAEFLQELGYEVLDKGFNSETSSDHPLAAFKVGEAVVSGEVDRGVVICGSGVGVTISANKVPGVYAFSPTSELQAKWSRKHNATNVIAFGADFIGVELAKAILKVWLETESDDNERYTRRRCQIADYEKRIQE